MKDSISTKNIRELFVSLAPIQALAAALPAINILISSFIIGNTLGSNALASMGFAGPYNYAVLAFANLVGMGSQLLVSKYIGSGSTDAIKKTFNTAIAVSTCTGLFLALISIFGSLQIAGLLGASGEIKALTADYIKGYALCSAFTIFSTWVLPFLQLDCAKLVSTISIVTQIVVNVGFNILNAYKLNWGMYGVGIASSLGSICSVSVGLLYLVFKSELFKFSVKSIKKEYIFEILRCGWPQSLVFVCLFFRDRVFNSVAFALGGAIALSAFTIANNISNCVGGTLQGAVSGPATMISSVLVGCHDVDSLREIPKLSMKLIFPFVVTSYILVVVFAKPICLFFGAEPEYIHTYILAMILFNSYFLTNTLKSAVLSTYNALEQFKAISVFNTLSLLVFPCTLFMIGKWTQSLSLIFLFTLICETLLIVTFAAYYKIKTGKIPLSLSKIIYVPRTFAVSKDNTLILSINSLREVSSASEKVITFCKNKGMSDKLSFYSGLCIEEVAADNILNNFPKLNKKCSIDIRVFYENGQITIMMRDNGPAFNINNWLELYAEDDPSRSIGLKMVSKAAKKIIHNNTLGLNILTIKL